jgi:hypothetical protein
MELEGNVELVSAAPVIVVVALAIAPLSGVDPGGLLSA